MIVGAGPIGVATIEFARIADAQVIVMDVNEHRLHFCSEQLNIQHVLNPEKTNITDELKKIIPDAMPTVVIDATGNKKAINNGINYLSHGGRYILIGLQKGKLIFSHPDFHKKEATLMSSRNATKEDFTYVIDCIKKELVHPLNYVTHTFQFDKAKKDFPTLLKSESGIIKAMIEMS